MNGLKGARVVVLDDEYNEAIPIIKAFSQMGVPVAYFDGKTALPTSQKRLRGIRLAILDMNLGVTGSNESIASTLVQAFSRIIDDDNGPYGILIWTNHPDLRDLVARYIYASSTLPKPVFIVTLKKASFKTRRSGTDTKFAIRKLTRQLRIIQAENSPLECLQVWEEACFRATTNVTNNLTSIDARSYSTLDEWRSAWQKETSSLLLAIGRAHAAEHHTEENCLSSIFIALNPLHSDQMDLLSEQTTDGLSQHIEKIMKATGAATSERKSKVNSMLHLAADQLDVFNPGNVYVFTRKKEFEFMPTLTEALQDCLQGVDAVQTEATKASRLCGIEVTPACDHAQKKMRVSRIVTGILVPFRNKGAFKLNAGFLKIAGPFHLENRSGFIPDGEYMLVLNSRFVVTTKPSVVKTLTAFARVRPQLLADIQAWVSYQTARQGVMMLS